MAITALASGSSSLATTTVSFSAQAAGTLLVLSVTASDAVATSGTGRPESTGWTRGPDDIDWNETIMFALIASGSETSVQYKIASANPSVYALVAYDDGYAASPMGTSSNLHTHNASGTTSPPTTAITPASGSSWRVVAAIGGSRDNGSSFSNPSSMTASFTQHASGFLGTPDTYGNVQGSAIITGGSSSGTPTGTFGGGGPKCAFGQLWAFKIGTGGGSNTGTLSASAPKVTASISGASVNAGTLSASTIRPTTSISGQSVNVGTLAASAPVVTAAVSGASVNAGTVSAPVPRLTTSISDTTSVTGTLSASTPRLTTSIAGQSVNAGTVSASTIRLTSTVTGASTLSGAVSAPVPRLTATIAGTAKLTGTLSARTPLLTMSVTDLPPGVPIPDVLGLYGVVPTMRLEGAWDYELRGVVPTLRLRGE